MKRGLRLLVGGIFLLGLWCPVTAQDEDQFPAPGDPTIEPREGREAYRATIERAVKGDTDDIQVDYHVIELAKHTRGNSLVRSLFVPGWGQGFNGQPVKGTVIFLTFAVATVGAIERHRQSLDTYNEYENLGIPDSSLYDDYEDERLQAMLLAGAAITIYGYAAIDAYRNAYRPLYTHKPTWEVAVIPDPDGHWVSHLNWNKRF